MQKLLTFFSCKNISIYAIFNDQTLKDMLTNDIVSFGQLGPEFFSFKHCLFRLNTKGTIFTVSILTPQLLTILVLKLFNKYNLLPDGEKTKKQQHIFLISSSKHVVCTDLKHSD